VKHQFAIALVIAFACSLTLADSAHFKALYSFKGGADGQLPVALIADAAGNLYGIAQGSNEASCGQSCGTIFELSPTGGGWKKKTLYRFSGLSDGGEPTGQLVLDASGNLYGVAVAGGDSTCAFAGCGVVFELSPNGEEGGWTETVLYQFTNIANGSSPFALVQDKSGNLVGMNLVSCSDQVEFCGAIFQLSHTGSAWEESSVYIFPFALGEGTLLTIDNSGNIFGTSPASSRTSASCPASCGLIFELSPSNSGWTEKNIFFFTANQGGSGPTGAVYEDAGGHLFGTTANGGQGACYRGCGTVYELTKTSAGWSRTILHEFQPSQGGMPGAGLVADSAGNLYGTTYYGPNLTDCNGTGCGTVFKLTQNPNGKWSEKILHQFTGPSLALPSQLVIDGSGNLYGVARRGNQGGFGMVFQIIP